MKKYTSTDVKEMLETLRQDTSGVFQSSSELIHNASYNKKLDYLIKRVEMGTVEMKDTTSKFKKGQKVKVINDMQRESYDIKEEILVVTKVNKNKNTYLLSNGEEVNHKNVVGVIVPSK